MGGKPAKIQLPSAPRLDPAAAKYDASYVQALQRESEQAVKQAQAIIQEQSKKTGYWKTTFITFGSLVGLGVVIVIAILIYDLIARSLGMRTIFLPSNPTPLPSVNDILYIDSASYGTFKEDGSPDVTVDVSAYLRQQIQGTTTLPSFIVSYTNLGLSGPPVPNAVNYLKVSWYVGYYAMQTTVGTQGGIFPTLPTLLKNPNTQAPVSQPSPPMFSKLWSYITGGSGSGNLVSGIHDASSTATIHGNNAPLSGESEGAYGIQWWMYIQDWNYGYGKTKSIVKRADPTGGGVTNPNISLHPTDNALQVSVSVFPDKEGSSGKSTPAPAGHSGSTDDVFTCDVPNIPLQTWFSVSVTVFGRNMDIYIDGKLVKSCFLSGVPKPASGDIHLTPDGGFSGKICDFYHYPRMLTPNDALTFWSAGTSCKNSTGPTAASSTTGYSVKFGLYDATGKQVQQYAF